jgi:aryl-alcohol dehydrogenase-like predicted oxidoreductase
MNFGAPTSEAESIRILHAALDAGINLVDTADVYNSGESERIVGKGLADHRDDVFLATKVYYPTGSRPNDGGLSRQHILRACEESLRRLDTDHIDLYQLHRPLFDLPQDETLRALDDLIHQGKVRYIGVSTFPAWLTVEAIHISERLGLNRFVSEQPPYNLLDRRIENELVPMCQRYGLAILPWSPLGGGILAGRYPPGARPPKGSRFTRLGYFKERVSRRARELAVKIEQIAVEIGLSLPQLALLWVKEQPGVTSPIIGPRTLEHLQTALEIFDQELDPEIAVRLDELNPPGSAVADFFNTAAWMKMRVPIE